MEGPSPKRGWGRGMPRPDDADGGNRGLEQPYDTAGLQVEIDIVEHGPRGETGHGAHLTQKWVEEPGAHRGTNVSDRDLVALRHALERRIVAQAEVRLGHVHGQLVETELGVKLNLPLGLRRVFDPIGAVDLSGNRLDLPLDRPLERVEEPEVRRLRDRLHDELGQLERALMSSIQTLSRWWRCSS